MRSGIRDSLSRLRLHRTLFANIRQLPQAIMIDVTPTLVRVRPAGLIEQIDALLPQTQCGKCGHAGCRPYAEGIVAGEPINRCPPGGTETIARLGELLKVPTLPLDAERGEAHAQVAYIREAECIGCTKCIQACPVDAILGAAKQMHTVLLDECTGCDLCVAPCPVDCIEMHPVERYSLIPLVGGLAVSPREFAERDARRQHARQRFEARNVRLQRERTRGNPERPANLPVAAVDKPLEHTANTSDELIKKARIAVAMSRAQLNKSLKAFGHPPIAEQAAQLRVLQMEYEATERELERLLGDTPRQSRIAPDAALIKQAKLRVAMARAAVAKAGGNTVPPERLAALREELRQAELALSQAQDSTGSHAPA